METEKKLGFGLMRLPMKEGEVDLGQLCEMVDLFLSSGFDYFDTAWSYLGGRSEPAIKKALIDRHPRGQFRLATKMQAWLAKSEEEAKTMFVFMLVSQASDYGSDCCRTMPDETV